MSEKRPELEERKCPCPCKRTWRCMPSSDSKLFSVTECGPRMEKKRGRPARLEFENKKKSSWGFTGRG